MRAANRSVLHGTCFRRRLSARRAGTALGVVRRFIAPPDVPESALFQQQFREYSPAMSIEELESVVSSLPAAELARFSEWFEEFMADRWDRPIEQM